MTRKKEAKVNKAFKQALQQAVTMEDFLNVCQSFYDFKNAKLGLASKTILISQIDKVIALSGAKPKQ